MIPFDSEIRDGRYHGDTTKIMRINGVTEVLKIPTSTQVRAARSLLSMTQEVLSDLAKVSLSSLKKLEQLDPNINPIIELRYKTVMQIVSCLEKQGIEFLSDEDSSGVILNRDKEIHQTSDTNP